MTRMLQLAAGGGIGSYITFQQMSPLCPGGAGADGGKSLPEGAAMGRNDFGLKAYGGACPPPGKQHRYLFTVHALMIEKIEVPEDASPALIGFNLTSNCIDKAVLTTMYGS